MRWVYAVLMIGVEALGRRLLVAALCTGIIAVTAMAACADTPPDPQVLFERALVRVHETHVAPYLQYDLSMALTHKSLTKTYAYDVIERMADHTGRFTSLTADGSDSDDVHIWKTLVSPGLFLNAVAQALPSAPADGPPTIGRVVSVPYRATLVGEDGAGDCAQAYHLALRPTSDPDLHQLREIWIEPASMRICRATLEKRVYIISRERVDVTVDLGPGQFVDHYHLAGKGHTPLGTYSLAVDGSFRDVRNVETIDPKLFR